MTTDAVVTAWKGHFSLVDELTAEGNLALVECFDNFDPAKGFVFATYAGTCVRNAIWKRLRSFSSVVHRAKGKPTPTDIYINPRFPDLQSPEDYCGSRARTETYGPNDERTSDHCERNEGDMLPCQYQRLRRIEPEPDFKAELQSLLNALPDIEAKVISLRRHGLKLREVAEDLGVSTATASRLEQSAMERLTWNWSQLNSQATHVVV
jgi:RNA polymerase sigma factor (sigma-70 family)